MKKNGGLVMNNEKLMMLIEVKSLMDKLYMIDLIYSKITWEKGIKRVKGDSSKILEFRSVLDRLYDHLSEDIRLSE